MKVLLVTPYLYSDTIPRFQKNKTGFGILLEQMAQHIGDSCELSIFTNVITPETRCHNARIVKHTWSDVFCAARARDIALGVRNAVSYKGSLREKLLRVYYRMNCAALRHTIAEIQPDVIHCHSIGTALRWYYDVCRESGIPVLITLHGLIAQLPDEPQAERQAEIAFLRDACANGWPVSFISSGMKEFVRRAPYNLPHTNNITIITNGVDTGEPDTPCSVEADTGAYCLCVGSVCEDKNQMQVVRAFAALPQELRTRFSLVIAGNIHPDYPIAEEVHRLGLDRQVRLLGFVPHKQVLTLYRNASVTVLASQQEGFGLSLAESFVAGTPCVTFSDLPASVDLYDPCAMVLCRERSDEALAKAIETALTTAWDRDAIRRHGQKFSLSTMADRYVAWYQNAVKD